QLHQQGIEVWIDVVYNHTGEGGLWREKLQYDDAGDFDPHTTTKLVNLDPKEVVGLYSYRGLDNNAYYALSEDKQTYWNNTGVGNETRCNHKPMRKLILDSLRYYVEEFHIDGFRFDLAPVLGAKNGDPNTWDDPKNTVLQDIIDDPVIQENNVRIVAEPWALNGAFVGAFPSSLKRNGFGWGEWNGRFRDWWRAFINDDNWKLNSREGDGDGGFVMTASDRWYSHNGRKPYHSVNFITVHDGFTLYDVFTYPHRQNKCGPLNPVCCEQPLSAWCDRDSGEEHNRSRDWGADANGEAKKRQMMRNAFAALLFSHGMPMLYGGDEWMRTQLGNNNAYSTRADNPFNWFDWGSWQASDERHRMFDFVSKMTRLRKKHIYAFGPSEYGKGAPFAWKSPQNTDQVNWSGKALMKHYWDKNSNLDGYEIAILINMENHSIDFRLPEGRNWRRVVDTQDWFDKDPYLTDQKANRRESQNITLDHEKAEAITTATYGVPSRTIVILEAK
ncbi:MAG: alpha-amylase family glycosyl hydrolase, partial [Myxococcales bacterium]